MIKKRFIQVFLISVIIILTATFALHSFIRIYFPHNTFLSAIFPPLFAGFVCFFILIKTSQYYLKKVFELLNEACDPQRFLEEYQNFYKLTAKSKLNLKKHYHAINVSLGYLLLGQLNEAEQLLENTTPDKLNRFSYMINWSAIKIMQEKPDDAEKSLMLAQTISLPTQYDPLQARLALTFNQALVHYLRKEYEISARMITELQPEFTTKLAQLSAVYNLGLIAKETGDIQLARDYFSQVAEQGNTLFVAVKAREFLNQLA